MDYPIWNLAMGGGVLIGIVSILHVWVSHFAIGGGLAIAVVETLAVRRGDRSLRDLAKRGSLMLILISTVFGAISGVGIWITIGLVQPAATSALIHNFVWGWAIEYAFFILEVATALARSMVCEWGMSNLGPLAFGKKEGEVFLGREMSAVQTFSERTARMIDSEVQRIVTEQYGRAKKVLLANRPVLDRIADALIEYETLDAADVDVSVAGGTLSRPPPPKPLATAVVEKKKAAPAETGGIVPAAGKA